MTSDRNRLAVVSTVRKQKMKPSGPNFSKYYITMLISLLWCSITAQYKEYEEYDDLDEHEDDADYDDDAEYDEDYPEDSDLADEDYDTLLDIERTLDSISETMGGQGAEQGAGHEHGEYERMRRLRASVNGLVDKDQLGNTVGSDEAKMRTEL